MSARAQSPHGIGPVLAVLALLPLALTWPLPRVFRTHVLAAADQEAAPHIWGLWAAAHTGSLLPVRTDLQAFPDGIELFLVDPFNLPAYHLGALFGPAAGYNLVLWTGLVLAGVAGALLAIEWRGSAWVGAVAAMACPTLLANAADGMTEGFGVGMVGIFAALLLRARRTGRRRSWLGAALALGLTPWTGPYNAIWAALLGLGITISTAIQKDWHAMHRIVGVGLTGGLAGLPLARAVFRRRDETLPGGATRSGLPELVDHTEIFRGGVRTGADLLDPFLPVQLTGAEAPISHTAYQGIVLLICATVVAARQPKARPWLAGAIGFIALSFGPWLYFQGRVLEVQGAALAGPAGVAMLAVPLFGRLTRWYRAGAVATLMLAPLAARLAKAPQHRALLTVALIADVLLCAPLAWPLHHSPLPETAALEALPEPGALLEIPPVTSGQPPPGGWRDVSALAQVIHHRPVGGSMMGLGISAEARAATESIRELLRSGRLPAAERAALGAAGFRYLVLHTSHHPVPDAARQHLFQCLGPPLSEHGSMIVYDFGEGGGAVDCSPTVP